MQRNQVALHINICSCALQVPSSHVPDDLQDSLVSAHYLGTMQAPSPVLLQLACAVLPVALKPTFFLQCHLWYSSSR